MSVGGRLLSGVAVLAAIVESGGFTRAAVVLGMSDSGVRRAVSRLETREPVGDLEIGVKGVEIKVV
ncbi:helix-turn-helix domain-containing protein [Rouxiella sp. Mn2063]|uniref:helix-turn-helix domain-containing protein n=1 Tax=Rouxiella sp. Mn2063 TaxID=3395262 RepID=UPI003BC6CC8F